MPAWRFRAQARGGRSSARSLCRRASTSSWTTLPSCCAWSASGRSRVSARAGCGDAAAAVGGCSAKVLGRDRYWQTANEVFGLPERQAGKPARRASPTRPCATSRLRSRSRNMARNRRSGSSTTRRTRSSPAAGEWPGWPAALRTTLDDVGAPVRFAAVSWQELLGVLPLDPAAAAWASEKHGLHKQGRALRELPACSAAARLLADCWMTRPRGNGRGLRRHARRTQVA